MPSDAGRIDSYLRVKSSGRALGREMSVCDRNTLPVARSTGSVPSVHLPSSSRVLSFG